MNARSITAIFDSQAQAQEAQARLLSLGLPEDDVRVVSQSAASGQRTDGDFDGDKGFWESIKDFFVADDDRAAYSEGVRRGGYLLTARVDDARVDEAIEILESSEAVDLDARTEQWRSEGWSGEDLAADDAQLETGERQYSQRSDGSEEAIPIVQERLRVGKREVNRGGVRVRSYIVEEPVNESIELREEHVEVERRPVRRSATSADASDLLRERTIEVAERSEEPVIGKEAEVTEEVVVRKFEGTRTEGVSDTVRRTEVEVDDTTRGDGEDQPAIRPPPSSRGSSKRARPDSKPGR